VAGFVDELLLFVVDESNGFVACPDTCDFSGSDLTDEFRERGGEGDDETDDELELARDLVFDGVASFFSGKRLTVSVEGMLGCMLGVFFPASKGLYGSVG